MRVFRLLNQSRHPRPFSTVAPCARQVHQPQRKMKGPKERGTSLDKFHSEYIVYGDFVCNAPYTFTTSAFWVPLSKLIKNVKRATAEREIEELRANEFEEISSSSEDENDE